jgi:hypothetical protein
MAAREGGVTTQRSSAWPPSETVVAGAAVAVVVLSLLATTGASVTGLGDAPEAFAGAQTGSVLHAPGYPIHAALGAVAIRVVPGLSDAMVLNALSGLATVVTAVLIVVGARRLGASAAAAAIVGAGWAATASVWFYAGYAKHDATTTLWCGALVVFVVSRVGAARRPAALDLVIAGAVVGLSLGVGWAPVLSGAGGLVWWLFPRRGEWARLGIAIGAAVVGAGLVGVLVVAMTARSPETSWGGVDDAGSLVRLWTMEDFGLGRRVVEPDGRSNQVVRDGSLPSDLVGYVAVVGRDMGPALAVAGVAGLGVLWRRGRRDLVATLGLTMAGNIGAAAVVLSIEPWGFRSGIVQGGFVAPTLVAVAIAAAPAIDAVAGWARRWMTPWVPLGVAAVLVVGTSVVTHRAPATQLREPAGRVYADQVLEDLPTGAVVLAGSASSSFPLLARQADGVRPDVAVVAIDGLGTGWYRDQIARRHPRLEPGDDADGAMDAILAGDGPVFVDHVAQAALAERVGLRPIGVLAEVVDGTPGLMPAEDPMALVDLLDGQSAAAGMQTDPARTRWPNDDVAWAYARPLLVVARAAIDSGADDVARAALEVAAEIQPDRPIIDETLAQLDP